MVGVRSLVLRLNRLSPEELFEYTKSSWKKGFGIQEKTKCDYEETTTGVKGKLGKNVVKECASSVIKPKRKLPTNADVNSSNRLQCQLCPKTLRSKRLFLNHIKNHSKIDENKVQSNSNNPKCLKKHSTPVSLFRTLKTTNKSPPPQIIFSRVSGGGQKTQSLQSSLSGKTKLWFCQQCKFSTWRYTSLKRHEALSHNLKGGNNQKECGYKLKRQRCKLCSTTFMNLKRHLRLKHGKSVPHYYKCEHCSYKSPNKCVLTSHMKNSHKVYPFGTCYTCEKKFSSNYGLKSHYLQNSTCQPESAALIKRKNTELGERKNSSVQSYNRVKNMNIAIVKLEKLPANSKICEEMTNEDFSQSVHGIHQRIIQLESYEDVHNNNGVSSGVLEEVSLLEESMLSSGSNELFKNAEEGVCSNVEESDLNIFPLMQEKVLKEHIAFPVVPDWNLDDSTSSVDLEDCVNVEDELDADEDMLAIINTSLEPCDLNDYTTESRYLDDFLSTLDSTGNFPQAIEDNFQFYLDEPKRNKLFKDLSDISACPDSTIDGIVEQSVRSNTCHLCLVICASELALTNHLKRHS